MTEQTEPLTITLTDSEGNPLSQGDRVRITGSSRYGDTAEGNVQGIAPDEEGRERPRVFVAIDADTTDAEVDPEYTSSTGRLVKIEAKSEDTASE